MHLPVGPVITSPDGLFKSLNREVPPPLSLSLHLSLPPSCHLSSSRHLSSSPPLSSRSVCLSPCLFPPFLPSFLPSHSSSCSSIRSSVFQHQWLMAGFNSRRRHRQHRWRGRARVVDRGACGWLTRVRAGRSAGDPEEAAGVQDRVPPGDEEAACLVLFGDALTQDVLWAGAEKSLSAGRPAVLRWFRQPRDRYRPCCHVCCRSLLCSRWN